MYVKISAVLSYLQYISLVSYTSSTSITAYVYILSAYLVHYVYNGKLIGVLVACVLLI